jgi:hypothetical protein
MSSRLLGEWASRWYEADVACDAKTVSAYMDAATAAVRLWVARTKSIPAGIEITAVTVCNAPRSFGRSINGCYPFTGRLNNVSTPLVGHGSVEHVG